MSTHSKNPNPLFVKKPGETASQHMSRLRKEFPKKFGMQPGYKVVKKKFTSADIAAAEKRAVEKALAKARAEFATTTPAAVLSAPVVEEKPVAAAPVAAAPAPEKVAPATLSIQSAVPDTQLFGAELPPPPKVETPLPGAPPVPPPEPPAGTPGVMPTGSGPAAADGGKYGAMIWAMIVKLCCAIFGPGFEPMTVKDSQGHVIYDEGAEGVKVWVNYLASIGVKVFSPVVELWIFMGSYVGIRAGVIIAKFRKKKAAPGTAAPGTGPAAKEPAAPPASPAAKEPQPTPPTPPAQAATPASATGVVDDLDDEYFGA